LKRIHIDTRLGQIVREPYFGTGIGHFLRSFGVLLSFAV